MKKLSLFAVALSLAFGLGAGGWSAGDALAQAQGGGWKTDLPWTNEQKEDLEKKMREYHTPPADSRIEKQAEETAKRLLKQVEHDFNNISSDGKDKPAQVKPSQVEKHEHKHEHSEDKPSQVKKQ